MDRILKLVYDNWTSTGDPLPNGRHPIINDFLKNNDLESLSKIKGNIFLFDHSNFRGHNPESESVRIDQILNDDAMYVWPLEIRTTIDSVFCSNQFVYNSAIEYSLKDTISPELRKLMTIGKVKIVINYAHDPIDDMSAIQKIENYFNEMGIHGSNVILIPGNDCSLEYKKYYPYGHLRISSTRLLMCHDISKDVLSFPKVTSLGYVSDIMREIDLDINVIRPKRFSCFNRTMRPHRVALAYIALKLNLLENSIFSFLNKSGMSIESINSQLTSFGFYDNEVVTKVNELIPYQIDTHHLSDDERCGFNSDSSNKQWYADTYIHITSETRFQFGETPFISEKTFRPIANLQPFIFVGNYHSLAYLKELGFKTFSPFIDESYDNETSFKVRIKKIYNEIEKLNNMPISELHAWYYSITDILLHNQKRLLEFAKIEPYQGTIDYIKNLKEN
jgi:hypothetical protein